MSKIGETEAVLRAQDYSLIYEGDIVTVPVGESKIAHTVQTGETLTTIAARYHLSLSRIISNNPQLGGAKAHYRNLQDYKAKLVAPELSKAKSDPQRQATVTNKISPDVSHSKKIGVGMGAFHVDSDEVSLVTDCLANCAPLVIIDPKTHRHFLAHVAEFDRVEDIVTRIQESFPSSSELSIYLGRGKLESNTEKNIYLALKAIGYGNKVKFIPPSETLGVYKGQLFIGFKPWRLSEGKIIRTSHRN